MAQQVMYDKCKSCPNADRSVTYSPWHYCNNPNNRREFTVIRHYPDSGGEYILITPPDWCPKE